MEILTELVSYIKNVFPVQASEQWGAFLVEEILGPAQREVNPRESWGIRSPPPRREETQSGEEEREMSHFRNQPLTGLEARRMSALGPAWTLHVPTPPPLTDTQTHRHGTVTHHGPVSHQPSSRSIHTTMFGFIFIMKKFRELGYQKADGFPGLESP